MTKFNGNGENFIEFSTDSNILKSANAFIPNRLFANTEITLNWFVQDAEVFVNIFNVQPSISPELFFPPAFSRLGIDKGMPSAAWPLKFREIANTKSKTNTPCL